MTCKMEHHIFLAYEKYFGQILNFYLRRKKGQIKMLNLIKIRKKGHKYKYIECIKMSK